MKLQASILLIVSILASAALAQSPADTLSVSGVLTDALGNPVAGPVDITFTIYNSAFWGSPVWTEAITGVALDPAGRYHVALGSVNPLTAAAFATPDRWLTADVNGDGEMRPRLPLRTIPYAHNANLLDGSPASVFAASAQLVDGSPATTPVGWNDLSAVPAGFADGIDHVNDLDADPANELQNWGSLPGIPAGFADGTDDVDDPDADPTNELQNWGSLPGIPAGFADGTDDVDDPDADPTNELQDLSSITAGTMRTINISGGTGTMIDVDDGKWIDSGSNLFLDTGAATRVGLGVVAAPVARLDVAFTGNSDPAAIRATGRNSARGYLGVQGDDDFEGEMTLDIGGDEIGVLGLSVDAGPADNIGVLGHSNNIAGRFSHTAGNYVELGGSDFELRTPGFQILPDGRLGPLATGRSTFFGSGAGAADDLTSNWNTYIGWHAGYRGVDAYGTTAIGAEALGSCVSSPANTAVGADAMRSYIGVAHTGSNVAIGQGAMQAATVGSSNSILGTYGLNRTLVASDNTAVGAYTLTARDFGDSNTGVGRNAEGNADALTNGTALGHDATFSASNQVRIGNTAVTSIGGYSAWTNLSDGRFKKDIAETVPGLKFIKALRPVTYTIDPRAVNAFLWPDGQDPVLATGHAGEELEVLEAYTAADELAFNAKSRIVESGFIAQEVEAAARELGYDFSGVDAPDNDGDPYGLRYAVFVVPLVKAMQEQQEIIESLRRDVASLESLRRDLAALAARVEDGR